MIMLLSDSKGGVGAKYVALLLSEAFQKAFRPTITVRWVDVNKGDELNPKYRASLVAR